MPDAFGPDQGPDLQGAEGQGVGVTAATTVTLAGPSTATAGVASGAFTVSLDGTYTGTFTPTDGSTGGAFTPATLIWADTSQSQTFTYTASAAGTPTITGSAAGLTAPQGIVLAVSAPGASASAAEIAAEIIAALEASGVMSRGYMGPFLWLAETAPGALSPGVSGKLGLGVGNSGIIRGRLMDGTRAIILAAGDVVTMTTSFNSELITVDAACTAIVGTNLFSYALSDDDTADDVSPGGIKMTATIAFAAGGSISYVGPALIVSSP